MKKKQRQEQPQINPYKIDKLAKIPSVWKVLALKWWASGATYFFTFGVAGLAFLDQLILMWLILTMVIEYLINKVILWMSNDKDRTERFLPYQFPRKSIFNLLSAMLYAAILITLNFMLVEYVFKNYTIDRLFFIDQVGNGPLMFATLYTLLDFAWIQIRNMLTKKIKEKKGQHHEL